MFHLKLAKLRLNFPDHRELGARWIENVIDLYLMDGPVEKSPEGC